MIGIAVILTGVAGMGLLIVGLGVLSLALQLLLRPTSPTPVPDGGAPPGRSLR